jgi:hypothetical protein
MNGQWFEIETQIAYPVEADAEGDIRDAAGDIIASVSNHPEAAARASLIAASLNGTASLGIARVEDFEKAGKHCERPGFTRM